MKMSKRYDLNFLDLSNNIPFDSFEISFTFHDPAVVVNTAIQKQTKNRNETGSNLSLGTRLTVLSKRLGRKRCCDTTPDRCLECNRLTILTAHC